MCGTGVRTARLYDLDRIREMASPNKLVASILDFAAEALKAHRERPAAVNSLLHTAQRSCEAFMPSLGVTSLRSAHETLALCSHVLRAAREDASPPATTRDIDAAILACGRWRDRLKTKAVAKCTWAVVPVDVLWYLFKWFRVLDVSDERLSWYPGIVGRHGITALYSCTLVCRAWNSIGTEELWRSLIVPQEPKFICRLVDGIRKMLLPAGHGEFPETSFRVLLCIAIPLLSNLRFESYPATANEGLRLSVSGLARSSESCPNLLVFEYDGEMEENEDLTKNGELISVDLSGRKKDVSDDTVQTLVRQRPAIEELSLFDTAVTIVSIRALKTHHPLKLLTLGGLKDEPHLFTTKESETAIIELLSARGASLICLRIGKSEWLVSQEVADILSDVIKSLRTLELLGCYSTSVVGSLSHCLPALLNFLVDNYEEMDGFTVT
ncbi:hypothetical protein BDK51DRAFT_48675 [Blyttiomyces helicus]|uniref:F-box domain-containing protein n=1 Tax=Blyttiomyces helicus TaxID=388810 RepID=A0A4P9VXD6_9FUNG|nr:hypothetical protein BDK51DRAFT_48675 [Blyttiomyces helicus]|eukprot:RKO84391.1 hypothetical protein BDK51DRAFT_48675 [Blyttiomyces helicus]